MARQRNLERFSAARTAAQDRRATGKRIAELKAQYMDVMNEPPQQRGFGLERLLHAVFDAFDLDPHRSFRMEGEQIDGGFTLSNEHFLLEAKWQRSPVTRDIVDVFRAKVERRSEKTLGLLVSISGFEATAVKLHTGNHSPVILMDGADLYAVLDARIDLPELLNRKRRESSMTGRILLTAAEILGGR